MLRVMGSMTFGMACLVASQGRMAEAEEMMTQEVQDVAAEYGEDSPEWASAQSDFGDLLYTAGHAERSIDYFRRAASVPGRDDEARRDQLTYRMNVGVALQRAGRLDEAEAELRRGAEERLTFYGREHPGYAFGLEPLANLLLQRGDARQAATVAGEAVENLRRNEHPQLTALLVLRAVALHTAGEPPFPDLDELPDNVVEAVAEHVMAQGHDPALISALADALTARLGPDHHITRGVGAG
jgi:tetratricopeptide (TPR) repeat protein